MLVLRHVLHYPTGICSIVAFSADYEVELHGSDKWVKHEETGAVYLLDSVRLWNLWLVGRPKGQSSLKPDGMYYINAHWASEESPRFRAYKEDVKRVENGNGSQVEGSQAQGKGNQEAAKGRGKEKKYTKSEKKWVKKHHESELKFLLQHGLGIHSEDEREEGKAIVRAMRKEERGIEG